jgi:hypothetical protein
MIPTRYKSKLSHKMTYQVSAGMLSTALADVPQFDRLSVAFSVSCQEPNKLKNPCRILQIGYSRSRVNLTTSKKSIEYGWYQPQWKIYVYAVPKVIIRSVKHQLETEGFGKVYQWLNIYQDATGKDGKCWLRLFYDMDTDSLAYEEVVELIDRN